MRSFPELPPVETAPEELLSGGHLWIQERIDGGGLRFQLRPDGRIRVGDADGVFDDGDVPAHYRPAVRHVRERLDRAALRGAVEDVTAVVAFGASTHRRTVPYDFRRMPPFLGFDVWDGTRGRFLAPDAVERVFERLGLRPVNAFEKELRAVDFDPDRYRISDSEWYDGPAYGVVIRDKTGHRAGMVHPDFRDADGPRPLDGDVGELADELVTEARIRRVIEGLAGRGEATTVPAVVERTVEVVLREEHGRIAAGGGEPDVEMGVFREVAARRVRRVLDERGRS